MQGRLILFARPNHNHRSISCIHLSSFLWRPNTRTYKFPLSKTWHDYLWNKAFWQGKIVNFLPYTRRNKTCQEKIPRLSGAFVRDGDENYLTLSASCRWKNGNSISFIPHVYVFSRYLYVQKKNTQAIFFKKGKISFSSLKYKFFANTEFYIGIAILEFSVLLYNV